MKDVSGTDPSSAFIRDQNARVLNTAAKQQSHLTPFVTSVLQRSPPADKTRLQQSNIHSILLRSLQHRDIKILKKFSFSTIMNLPLMAIAFNHIDYLLLMRAKKLETRPVVSLGQVLPCLSTSFSESKYSHGQKSADTLKLQNFLTFVWLQYFMHIDK